MTTLLDQIAAFKSCTVLVVGDFMLDEFIYGDAERLSPDAPVPVLRSERTERSAGGSANVATCLQGLGAAVACCGVVGSDAEGRWLIESLAGSGADVDGLVVDESRPTTVKRSLVGLAQHRHPQKMFRIDVESSDPLADVIRDRLLETVRDRIQPESMSSVSRITARVSAALNCVGPSSISQSQRARRCWSIQPVALIGDATRARRR